MGGQSCCIICLYSYFTVPCKVFLELDIGNRKGVWDKTVQKYTLVNGDVIVCHDIIISPMVQVHTRYSALYLFYNPISRV